MPRPTWPAESPTIWVKKTALPVMKVPSPTANSTDCSDSRRASGVGGRKRSEPRSRAPARPIRSRGTSVRRVDLRGYDDRGRGRALGLGDGVRRRAAGGRDVGLDRHAEAGRAVPRARCSRRWRRPPAGSVGEGRWLLALPASYVAGAQVVCRSVVGRCAAGAARGPPVLAAAVEAGRPAYASPGADPAAPDARRPRTTSPRCARCARCCSAAARSTRRCARGRADGGVTRGRDVRLGGDGRRLRLRRGRARRRRARDRARRAAADLGADAVRRVRRRPGADRAGAGRRLVPDRGRRADRRGRAAAGAGPARRHGGHRRGERAGAGGGPAAARAPGGPGGRGARRPRRGVGHRGWWRSWSAT